MPEEPMEDGYPFGELDREPIKYVVLKLKGSGIIARLPAEGETMELVIRGEAGFGVVKRGDGVLYREVPFSAGVIAEPGGALADEAAAFLVLYEDEQRGRQQIPGIDGEAPEGVDPDTGEVLDPKDEDEGEGGEG